MVAAVGLVTTLRALPHSRRSDVDDERVRWVVIVLYAVVGLVGAAPELAEHLDLAGIQAEAILLILLVVAGHGMVWRFMTSDPMTPRD